MADNSGILKKFTNVAELTMAYRPSFTLGMHSKLPQGNWTLERLVVLMAPP
jgi:hypothetical protein